jgi:putative ABC transport system permease protein
MQMLRNIFRRKLRAALTIFGITIGIFALVVMGGMAEKINLLISGGTEYYKDKVLVTDKAGSIFGPAGTPVSVGRIAEIEAVDGVARASAGVGLLLEEDGNMSMGMPQMITGDDRREIGYETFPLRLAEGRALAPEDRGKVALGSDVSRSLEGDVGKTVELRGSSFEVVGIYEKTLTGPDSTAFVSLADAQQMFYSQLPAMIQQQVQADTLATQITVYPESGVDADQLALTIEAAVPGIKATGPQAFIDMFKSMTRIFNSIIFGVALISLLVGGLSVVNTMTMSVAERTREIGIRKAIGASHRQIVWQFLSESAFIGFLGGATGLLLGWVTTVAVNAVMSASGNVLFLVTPRLAIGALAFAVALGVGSGFYPSLHAARLKPVLALRYE